MNSIALRTDKPLAELYLIAQGTVIDSLQWEAHRMLAETIHKQLEYLLSRQGLTISQTQGIVFYNAGESFTGIRIGASVANALAAGLQIPVIGVAGDAWLMDGVLLLEQGKVRVGEFIDPHYAALANITAPRK